MLTAQSIDELVRRRKPGYSLDAPFYTSTEIYDLDLDLIWGRHWLMSEWSRTSPNRAT